MGLGPPAPSPSRPRWHLEPGWHLWASWFPRFLSTKVPSSCSGGTVCRPVCPPCYKLPELGGWPWDAQPYLLPWPACPVPEWHRRRLQDQGPGSAGPCLLALGDLAPAPRCAQPSTARVNACFSPALAAGFSPGSPGFLLKRVRVHPYVQVCAHMCARMCVYSSVHALYTCECCKCVFSYLWGRLTGAGPAPSGPSWTSRAGPTASPSHDLCPTATGSSGAGGWWPPRCPDHIAPQNFLEQKGQKCPALILSCPPEALAWLCVHVLGPQQGSKWVGRAGAMS